MSRLIRLQLGMVAALILVPGIAVAAPVAESTIVITDDGGAFSIEKTVQVFNDASGDDPFPADGLFTYVYKLTSLSGDGICSFKVNVPDTNVVSAGFIDTGGVNPTSVTVGPTQVNFQLAGPPPDDFNCIFPFAGYEVTSDLYLTSSFAPAAVGDLVTAEAASGADESGECLGPVEPPAVGDPMPCTIGFWKNRSLMKKGLLQFFVDPEFDQVVTAAVALSAGLFADETALLTDLQSKGNRPIDQRARQQLAATYLNLAAGDLFPDNGKCQLFEENSISANACGTGITVGDGVSQARTDVDGDEAAQHDAAECADDINNSIGIVE